METIPLLFETYGAGNQNLYVNVSGMDIWIENSMLPHCYSVNNNATCDLNVENDMPRVISQDETEGGLDGSALTIGIRNAVDWCSFCNNHSYAQRKVRG